MRRLLLLCWLLPAPALAAEGAATDPILADVTREQPVFFLLEPGELRSSDYAVEWSGDPVPGVQASIEPGSLQWVRAGGDQGVLRLPRARILVVASDAEAATVSAAGSTQALARDESGALSARMLVPLVSGDANPVTVRLTRSGAAAEGELRIRFRPRGPGAAAGRIFVDTTCSAWGVRAESSGSASDEWMYVGCRVDEAESEGHRTSSLELVVFWDGVGGTIGIDGVDTPSGGASVWSIRASSSPGSVSLRAGDHAVTLQYRVPSQPRHGFVGLGLGPYYDSFRDSGIDTQRAHRVEPLATAYGSFVLSPTSRLVAFNATPMRKGAYSDTGLYLQRKTSETLDRRVVFNVFLGAHLLYFQARGKPFFRPSAPQGVEVMVRDVGPRGRNLTLGGLVNPGIGGRSYYNGWLRWGSSRLFLELNYIGWNERAIDPSTAGDTIDLKSFGLSLGGQLFRFL